jgi:hypothetical protein
MFYPLFFVLKGSEEIMKKTDNLNELFTALSKAQGEIENAKKDSTNPFFKSKYADLAEVINVAKEPLSNNGLSVLQLPSNEDGVVTVSTILAHSSGQYIINDISATAEKLDIQTIGKLITYLRRYSYSAIVGIAQEDDDGNAASGKTKPEAKPQAKPEKEKIEKPAKTLDDVYMLCEKISREELAAFLVEKKWLTEPILEKLTADQIERLVSNWKVLEKIYNDENEGGTNV